MSIKPFSEKVSEPKQEVPTLKPFVDKASGGVAVDEQYLLEREIQTQQNIMLRMISFMGSARGIIVSLLLFVLVVLLVDAIATFQELLLSDSLLDGIYLLALVILILSLTLTSYKNLRQIRALKSAERHQRAFSEQKRLPTKAIVPMTLELLSSYDKRDDQKLRQSVEILKERISSSHEYSDIYKELDEVVLEQIDLQVQERIKTASAQAALSTAISPLALLDAVIVVWRGVRLTKEIAELYGFKPGWIATVLLLRRGAFSIFFVGATELAVEYMNAASESTVVSKISLSAGQGISNGVLLARIGYGVMSACRPLPMRIRRQSFLRSMVSTIKETIINGSKKRQEA